MKHEEAMNVLVERIKLHGEIQSLHEAYGLLAEELAELLDAIRKGDPDEAMDELLDIAVVAMSTWMQFS